jgi:hypothetical protein
LNDGLRIVVWDETDTSRLPGIRRRRDPGMRVRPGHDGTGGTSRVEIGLSPAWWLGAKVHGLARGRTPFRARGVRSWEDAIRFALDSAQQTGLPIADFQAWGHGGWGFMDLGDTRLEKRTLPTLPLEELSRVMTRDALFWVRCCSAFGARSGRAFAQHLADHTGHRVAGHSYVIGVLQSGTHSLAPGAEPDWPVEEGVIIESGEFTRAKGSGPRQPRTIGCLRLDLPRGW